MPDASEDTMGIVALPVRCFPQVTHVILGDEEDVGLGPVWPARHQDVAAGGPATEMNWPLREQLEGDTVLPQRKVAGLVADVQYNGKVNDYFQSSVTPGAVVAGACLFVAKVVPVVEINLR